MHPAIASYFIPSTCFYFIEMGAVFRPPDPAFSGGSSRFKSRRALEGPATVMKTAVVSCFLVFMGVVSSEAATERALLAVSLPAFKNGPVARNSSLYFTRQSGCGSHLIPCGDYCVPPGSDCCSNGRFCVTGGSCSAVVGRCDHCPTSCSGTCANLDVGQAVPVTAPAASSIAPEPASTRIAITPTAVYVGDLVGPRNTWVVRRISMSES